MKDERPILQGKGGRLTYRQWVEQNPLRAWRTKQRITGSSLAITLGVNYYTFHLWEIGSNNPPGEAMARIARLLGKKQFDLEMEWAVWKDKHPRIEGM